MTRFSATGTGQGKVILLGEHAVVYGHPALAASVSLQTRVTLSRRPGPTALTDGRPPDSRLERALALTLPPDGIGVTIESSLPTGRGMGSSAALAVALLRARADLDEQPLSPASLHEKAFALERIFHGNPSGLDHAVAAQGGVLCYRRNEPPVSLEMQPTPVVILDTGVPGDTAAMVAAVGAARPQADGVLAELGKLVEATMPHLDDRTILGAAMNTAHDLLASLGISTPKIEALVTLARAHGAFGAKLSGAGGGGVVLALSPLDPSGLLRAAQERGMDGFCCTLPDT